MSSTFWSERIGFAAGIATLNEMRRIKSWRKIKKTGQYIKYKLHKIALKNKLKINFKGLDGLINFELKDLKKINYKRIITEMMLQKKFLAGNVLYLSTAHNKKLVDKYIYEMDKVFKSISSLKNK